MDQIYLPVMRVFPPTRIYHDLGPKLAQPRPDPGLDWRSARAIGRRLMAEQAAAKGFAIEWEDCLLYKPETGQFAYGARTDREVWRGGTSSYVVFDGVTGAFGELHVTGGQDAGETATVWLVALHDALLKGPLGRALTVALGVLAVFLSGSGVYLWWKRR